MNFKVASICRAVNCQLQWQIYFACYYILAPLLLFFFAAKRAIAKALEFHSFIYGCS